MEETKSNLRKLMAKPVVRWVLLAYFAFAAVGFAFALFSEISVRQEFTESILMMRQAEQPEQLEGLQEKVVAIELTLASLTADPASIAEIQKTLGSINQISNLDVVSLSQRLERIEARATSTDEELRELKQILNPTNPDDILRVLRLGDKFEIYGRS